MRAPLLLILVSSLLAPSRTLGSQTLVRESPNGNYRLTFTDLDGKTHTMVVGARDRVAPELAVSVTRTNGYRYTYALENRAVPAAQTAIVRMDIPCPEATVVASPASWSARIRPAVSLCSFLFKTARIAPGQKAEGYVIESSRLPEIAEVRVFGSAASLEWPSAEGSVQEKVYRLVHGVDGREGGWYRLAAVVPTRDPSHLDAAARGFEWLSRDLSRVCEARWVSHADACSALRARLDSAQASMSRADAGAARAQLDAFLQDLEDRRGKQVDENAYVLLTVIGTATRRRL